MRTTKVNGVELEYEMEGSGEPVLWIDPVIPGGFRPLMTEPALADHFHLIRYHKRGWAGSTHTPGAVTVEDHADDAAGLLEHLNVGRAHVAGHSSGGAVALQLALDRPDLVHTLILLEPTLFSVPSAGALFESVAPVLEAYQAGRHEEAVVGFLSFVSGLDPQTCRAVIDEHVPGGVELVIRDAHTLFGIELPGLSAWAFGAAQAATISHPVLSVRGTDTGQLWLEVEAQLEAWMPRVERLTVEGVGHLLHIQRPAPVAEGIAAFLARRSMAAQTLGSVKDVARSRSESQEVPARI